MRITRFQPANASRPELEQCYQVELAASRLDRPAEPAPTLEAAIARLTRTPSPDRQLSYVLARRGQNGQIIGVGYLMLLGHRPTDLAAINITVHPENRRNGAGTALLRELAAEALGGGRQSLLVEGLPDGSAGQAWAAARGFAVVQRTAQLSLDLTAANRARWQVPAAPGYRLAPWTGSAPESMLASYAAARNAIHEAPRGDMSFSEPEWTPQRVRDEEAAARARQCELRVVAAVHEQKAEVAGLTYLEIYQQRPELALQQDTAVLKAHRGHGLGVWMKAANLLRLTADHPQVRQVLTSNAADNEHMLAVNSRIGFTVDMATEIRQAPLADLAARLGL